MEKQKKRKTTPNVQNVQPDTTHGSETGDDRSDIIDF